MTEMGNTHSRDKVQISIKNLNLNKDPSIDRLFYFVGVHLTRTNWYMLYGIK